MGKSLKTFIAVVVASVGLGTLSAQAADGNTSDLVNRSVLRVCADPANLPFSGKDKPGFENKIVDIVADELGVPVQYTWFPQATGFIRRTLFAKRCDLVPGYAQGDEMVLNTNHYYRSTYALVYPEGKGFDGLKSLSDPRLKDKRVGVIAGTPPGDLLVKYGLIGKAKPYQLTTDRRHFSPNERMVEDIRSGDVDVGVLWGPIAGYFANRGGDPLTVQPLTKEEGPRMAYRITMGVRQSDSAWKRQLNEILKKRQKDIEKVLLEYGVPLLDEQDKQITSPRG